MELEDWVKSFSPTHQKATSQVVVLRPCNIHAIRNLPLPLPVKSHPAAIRTEYISRDGMAMTRKKRRSEIVM